MFQDTPSQSPLPSERGAQPGLGRGRWAVGGGRNRRARVREQARSYEKRTVRYCAYLRVSPGGTPLLSVSVQGPCGPTPQYQPLSQW